MCVCVCVASGIELGASAHKVIPYVNGKHGGFGSACAHVQSDLGLVWLSKCSVSGHCGIVNGLSLCDAAYFYLYCQSGYERSHIR